MDRRSLRDYFLLKRDFLKIEYPPSYDSYQILQVRIHNVSAVLGLFLAVFLLIGDIYEQDVLRGLSTLMFIASIFFVLALAREGYFSTAKVVSINLYASLITLLVVTWGRQLGAQFAYIIVGMLVITFFGKRAHQLIGTSSVLIYFLIGEIYLYLYSPLIEKSFSDLTYFTFFGCTLWAITLFSTYYLNTHRFLHSQTLKLMDSLIKNNAILEHKNKELERFAYIASHDLKTPLRQVISFLGLVNKKIEGHPKQNELEDYMSYATEGASRMYNIIEDLLEYSVIDNLQQTDEEGPVNLNEVVAEVKRNLAITIQQKKGIVTTSSLPTIYSQRLLVHSIFHNLIENGLVFNKNLQPSVHIQYEQNGQEHYFYFQDNGIGVDPKYHQHIFEMFKRLHTIDQYPGSGIGLAICQRAVELLGGAITLSSSPGHGSTFVLCFSDEQGGIFKHASTS